MSDVERCSAADRNGYQCRCTANLTHTIITPQPSVNLDLPESLHVRLCPKHFVWSKTMRAELGIDAALAKAGRP